MDVIGGRHVTSVNSPSIGTGAAQFSEKLASIMKKILLVSEVAALGRAFERYVNSHKDEMTRRRVSATSYGVNSERLRGMITSAPDESNCADGDESTEFLDITDAKYVIDPNDRHPMTGALSQTQKARILTLLGAWAEPTLAEKKTDIAPSVNEILQFRRALEYLHTSFPFSGSFGLADRRETTIESAQEVYERLLLRSPDADTLTFDVIALLGVGGEGDLDCDKLKDLIKLFRPDRDGTMEIVDFVKSVSMPFQLVAIVIICYHFSLTIHPISIHWYFPDRRSLQRAASPSRIRGQLVQN